MCGYSAVMYMMRWMPREKQRDTMGDMVQSKNDRHGVPNKGMRQVLSERHVDVYGMTAEQMRSTIAAVDGFKNEQSLVIKKGHIPTFLPKFHPELNPIKRVWAQLDVMMYF